MPSASAWRSCTSCAAASAAAPSASVCVLLYTAPLSDTGKARLRAMAETTDGFEIARRDLEIRGPGEFLGARQSGDALLRFADLEPTTRLARWLAARRPRTLRTRPGSAGASLPLTASRAAAGGRAGGSGRARPLTGLSRRSSSAHRHLGRQSISPHDPDRTALHRRRRARAPLRPRRRGLLRLAADAVAWRSRSSRRSSTSSSSSAAAARSA